MAIEQGIKKAASAVVAAATIIASGVVAVASTSLAVTAVNAGVNYVLDSAGFLIVLFSYPLFFAGVVASMIGVYAATHITYSSGMKLAKDLARNTETAPVAEAKASNKLAYCLGGIALALGLALTIDATVLPARGKLSGLFNVLSAPFSEHNTLSSAVYYDKTNRFCMDRKTSRTYACVNTDKCSIGPTTIQEDYCIK